MKQYFGYSQCGTDHTQNSLDNQDYYCHYSKGSLEALLVADGVSTAGNGLLGARLACEFAWSYLLRHADSIFRCSAEETANRLFLILQEHLHQEAITRDIEFSSLSSTLSLAFCDHTTNRLFWFSVGDSLIYLIFENKMTPAFALFADSSGAIHATTTDQARYQSQVISTANLQAILLCSDGSWRSFYRQGVLLPQLAQAATQGDYYELKKHIVDCSPQDDATLVVMYL